MFIQPLALIVTIAGIAVPSQQDLTDLMLAVRFGKESTRPGAVAEVVAAGSEKVPLLLSWTRNPPGGVDRQQLYIGMADAFGELRTKQAIPFLIKNISFPRHVFRMPFWSSPAPVVEYWLPSVAALIKIGPEASEALIRASEEPMARNGDDWLAVVFAVAQIGDPRARDFLTSAAAKAKTKVERYWAEEGLKRLDGHR